MSTIVVDRSSRSRARRAMKETAPAGSRLAVGSSSTRTSGLGASAPPRARRCCCPPDSRLVRSRSRPARPMSPRTCGTRSTIAWRGHARFSSPKATSSSTRSITSCVSGSCQTIPTRAATWLGSRTRISWSSSARRPPKDAGMSRGIKPPIASASVLLPEPDGPTTSMVWPAGNSNETPSRASRSDPRWPTERS